MNNRADDWLRQAENDFLFAESALKEKFFSQCCFICQQAGEKALKSIAYRKGATLILGHSLVKLCETLKINGRIRASAGILDQYYLAARYPDALPGGAPCDVYSEEQAQQALAMANMLLEFARQQP